MRAGARLRYGFATLVLGLASGASAAAEPSKEVSFRDHVAPILARKCLGCHNARKAAGGLDMSTFALLRKGGKSGGELILDPGDPDSSQLIELVRPGAAPRMPYKQPPLGQVEIRTLERWVKEGARFDGPSEERTPIASLVDPLRNLPRVTLKAPAADPVTALAFTPDGKTLAAALGRRVVLFDSGSGKAVATLAEHPGPLAALRNTPDGKTLVAAGGRPGMFGSVTTWDLEKKTRRLEFRGHSDSIVDAAVAPDGKTLATSGYDKLVVLWDLERGTEIRALKDHTDAVHAVAFSPDGRTLASAAADRTVKLWDVASGQRLRTLADATAELYALAFDKGGETVLAGGVDRSIRAWRVADRDAPLVRSAFAHDAAILRLVVSADGKTLVSSGEDRDVKVWDLATLSAKTALSDQSDWPLGLAISPDGSRIAVGRYDGSLSIYDGGSGKVVQTLSAAPRAATPSKPELVRNATLDPPSPRGASRGASVRLTLTGNGVGRATEVAFGDRGLAGSIVAPSKPDANRLEVDLTVSPVARVGIHRLGVVTPLGVPPFQPFAVWASPESSGSEPDDVPSKSNVVALPTTFSGTIERPGDIDHFRFEAKAAETLVFEATARALGSNLLGVLTVLDDQGRAIAEAGPREGAGDPLLTLRIPRDGTYALRVADADYGGSGNHFYRIAAGMAPLVSRVFPLAAERGTTAKIRVEGQNLGGIRDVALPVSSDAEAGSILPVPITLPDGSRPVTRPSIVVAEGPQGLEVETSETPAGAQPVAVPGGVSGRIDHPGDADLYRFEAVKGQRVIVEVFSRRLGSATDPVVEVLDLSAKPVPRAVLRPLDQTEVAFRDHDSTTPGIRLTRWNNLAIDDYLLIGRELARVEALPKNPDDDCAFWSEQKQRLGFLETTPEHHPISQPAYKVEIHPPGTSFPPGGLPTTTVPYRNDDGGPGYLGDSRLTFDPPTSGAYLARVEDVRGHGGEDHAYHLALRRPRPDFRLTLGADNPNIPRGGTTLLTVNAARVDGFEGPVDVEVEGLPPGVVAAPCRIESRAFSASLGLSADASAPAFSPPTWRVVGRAPAPRRQGGPGTPAEGEHAVDPGGPAGGWITVTPPANLELEARPARVSIRPGQRVALTLAVRRGPAFAGRVPIEVRNLPRGVRVLNLGLNGVLITEREAEREVWLYAEPWAEPQERPFFAVGRAEAAGTEHSSPAIALVVRPEAVATRASSPAGSP